MVSSLALPAACGSDDAGGGGTGGGNAGGAGIDSGSSGAGGTATGGTGGAAGVPTDGGLDVDASPECGNGTREGGEQCDLGTSNGPGAGCESDCTFSCQGDGDCSDAEVCNGDETCVAANGGQSCTAGTPLGDDSPCGSGGYCKAGVCTQPTCGDGVVEPGETCDPPNGGTCNAECIYVECGDGSITGDEHCDDGNTTNWDGCSSDCRYEMVQRGIDIGVPDADAPSYCIHRGNQFGKAFFADDVRNQLADSIKAAQQGGAGNLLFALPGLDDLTGADDSNVSVGIVSADLDPRYAPSWTPNAIDGWFVAQPSSLSSGQLVSVLPGSISSHVLTAGPADVALTVVSGTTPSVFDCRDTMYRAKILDTPAPDVPAPPPGALAAGLEVFQQMDAMSDGLCGALTVESLSKVVVPSDMTTGGATACQPESVCPGGGTKNYTFCGPDQPVGPGCNSMLDVLIGGCKVTTFCIVGVTPTQPDVGAGGNAPATLVNDPNDFNKVSVVEPDDAYSFWVQLATNRVHLTNNLP